MEKIVFIPLKGGEDVGGSCYYLKLGNNHILLDAGCKVNQGLVQHQDLEKLVIMGLIDSVKQISYIFISHAHFDHMGDLINTMVKSDADVYMSKMSKLLCEYQLYDNVIYQGEEHRLALQNCLEKIHTVSYLETKRFKDFKVTFYEAGHIPGAMMMLFEYKKRKILYTGDYAIDASALCGGCKLADNLNVDTMILCGLHAKQPSYQKNNHSIYNTIDEIYYQNTYLKKSIQLKVGQSIKKIELLALLNEKNIQSERKMKIYIDQEVMQMVNKLEEMNIPIIKEKNYLYQKYINEPHILISNKNYFTQQYQIKNVDFTLHEDFKQMEKFIKKVNPKYVYIVHCGKGDDEAFIQQHFANDLESETYITFSKNQEIYLL